jgi:hypothetical protein
MFVDKEFTNSEENKNFWKGFALGKFHGGV